MNTAAFILILFAHVGPMGQGNSNALTVAEFTTAERCAAAGQAARKLAHSSVKSIEWVCVAK
jgi:hypothetical protein